MCWKRARKPEQVEKRKADIIFAAAELFDEVGFEGVSLNGIARRAGQAKSNLYRYFDSREHILLSMLVVDLRLWVTILTSELESSDGSVEDVASIFAESGSKNPRMLTLISILATVLERNISEDVVREFKENAHEFLGSIVQVLSSKVEGLGLEEAGAFVNWYNVLTAGMWPMSNPDKTLCKVLDEEKFSHMKIDFKKEMIAASEAMLRGLILKQEKKG